MNEETGKPILNEAVEKLKNHKTSADNSEELLDTLGRIRKEIELSVPHKVTYLYCKSSLCL